MKRILITSCMFLFMLSATQVVAQEKVKVKDDKTKVKDGDAKTKTKDDKTKVKDGDDKTKMKDDKTKVKDGDDKTKITDDKMKMKDGDDKTKITDDKIKVKDNEGTIKIKGEDGMNTMTNVNPYTASYSSNYVMGNPAHTNMIVDMWKDWDDNAFDRHNYWADDVTVFLSDGTVIKGRDSSLAGAKRYRGSLKSAKSTITAMLPLRSTDRNEDWVAIWGTETNTMPDGKVERNDIHEIWRINKDGKIDQMRQYTAKPAPQQ